MEIFRGVPPKHGADASPTGSALALGNFDGVHRGHATIIASARAAARRLDATFAVVTFEPHPRSLFRPDAPPFRLTPEPQKTARLAALGVERLHILPFNHDFASLSAEQFAVDVLAGGLGARHVVVGADFRFGQGRQGDPVLLERFGQRAGFTTETAALVGDDEGEFSSTAAREALREGRPQDAARILGDWHRIDGAVLHGEKRGRTLGFPTANLSLAGLLQPAFGVYAVRAEVLDGRHAGLYDGAASLGVKPTFGRHEANLETFLFDFDGDLYDARLSVSLCAYLRGEVKYEGVEPLIAQMRRDCDDARAALAALPPL